MLPDPDGTNPLNPINPPSPVGEDAAAAVAGRIRRTGRPRWIGQRAHLLTPGFDRTARGLSVLGRKDWNHFSITPAGFSAKYPRDTWHAAVAPVPLVRAAATKPRKRTMVQTVLWLRLLTPAHFPSCTDGRRSPG